MVYTDELYQPPIVELAKAGNFQAIAHWINQYLMPYGMQASVGAVRPGCLKILVELPWVESGELPEERRDYLVRYICHRIWQLNSAVIEGAQIAAQFTGESSLLWQQSVKVVSPARRLRQQQSLELRTQVQQTAQRKVQLKTFRAFLISGAPIFAFMFGCLLGFSKAPVEQTNAVASSQPSGQPEGAGEQPARSDTVQAALETVPVTQHTQVADPNDPTVTLMFSGDVTLGESFESTVGKDYDHAFAAMDEYRKADLAMINLENPLTKATVPLPDKQFNFKADPESVQILEKGGVDLVTLANNHTMDFETAGLTDTIDTLDKAGILHMGAGRDEKEARRPEIVEVKGQRVAYLGYYGADLHSAGENKAGTNIADEARIAADIKSIRDQVDWIVVNYHWGEELANYPAEWQVDLAHFTVDQGADVVVGHHPHVLQGAEIYKGRPIAYSLGNFIFGGNSRKDYDTAVMKVALKDRQMKVEFLPVEVRNYQPEVVSGDRGSQILHQVDDLSSGFAQPMRSPAILDARLSPKVEPSSAPPAAQPATPKESTTPFLKPETPTEGAAPAPAPTAPAESASPSPTPTAPADSKAPAAEPSPAASTTPSPQPTTPGDAYAPPAAAPTPSSEASPSPTAPGDAAPAGSSAPSVEASPSPQSTIPGDAAAPPADTSVPSGDGTPSPQPTVPGDAASPSEPALPQDTAQPQTPSTTSDSAASDAQPSQADNAISPDNASSSDVVPADTPPSESYEAENSGATTAEEPSHSDGSTHSGDSLTDPAEADRLLREAEQILQDTNPPAATGAPSNPTGEPPTAVGGPADPVEPAPSAPADTSTENHSTSSAPVDSSAAPVDSSSAPVDSSSAPVDFSQPPDPNGASGSYTPAPADSPASADSTTPPSTEPSGESVSEHPAEPESTTAPSEPSPGSVSEQPSESDPTAPVDTSFASPTTTPDGTATHEEKVALSYLAGSHQPTFHEPMGTAQPYHPAEPATLMQNTDRASVPAVALMAAAIW